METVKVGYVDRCYAEKLQRIYMNGLDNERLLSIAGVWTSWPSLFYFVHSWPEMYTTEGVMGLASLAMGVVSTLNTINSNSEIKNPKSLDLLLAQRGLAVKDD